MRVVSCKINLKRYPEFIKGPSSLFNNLSSFAKCINILILVLLNKMDLL